RARALQHAPVQLPRPALPATGRGGGSPRGNVAPARRTRAATPSGLASGAVAVHRRAQPLRQLLPVAAAGRLARRELDRIVALGNTAAFAVRVDRRDRK